MAVPFSFEVPSVDIPPEIVDKLVATGLVYRHPDRPEALAAAPYTPHTCLILLVVLRNALELAHLAGWENDAESNAAARQMKKAIDLSLEDAMRMVALLTQVEWLEPESTDVVPGFFDHIDPN